MKTLTLILIVFLAVPLYAEKPKPVEYGLHLSFISASIFDTCTTIYGTKRGLAESNTILAPLFYKRQYTAIWAIQAGACMAVCLAVRHLCSDPDTRWLGYSFMTAAILFRLYCGIHNAKLNSRL